MTIKTRLFKHTLILLFIVGILDLIAEKFYLYFTTSWFDTIVHFLAGACVAMAGFLALSYFSDRFTFSYRKMTLVAILGAFIIGILWEFYELYFGITFLSDGIRYVRDTASDLLMDIVGGSFGAWYSLKLLKDK